MRVDFYHLTREPAEAVVPVIAAKILGAGQRALIVADDAGRRAALSDALWNAGPTRFLAHGDTGDDGCDAALQPILLSGEPEPANGASSLILADGQWRQPGEAFERVFLLFADDRAEDARAAWRSLAEADGVTRHYWKQTEQGWVEAG